MRKYIERFDFLFIHAVRRLSVPLARGALFIVFFWFGILKIVGTSPANPMVSNLLENTLPFISFENFIILFSLYEMAIGVAFLIPRFERLAIALLIPHMIMTCGPLIMLPTLTWQGFLTPTLEGQYIIKNLVIVALALGIAAHLTPLRYNHKKTA